MTNHMKEIAKMLGVRLGEHFRCYERSGELEPYGIDHYLSEEGMRTFCPYDGSSNWGSGAYDLQDILTGKLIIAHPPYKPLKREKYWYVRWTDNHINAWLSHWFGSFADYTNLKTGNCFRTKEEAEENKYRIYEELTGRKWE